jgi:hypothetical protein
MDGDDKDICEILEIIPEIEERIDISKFDVIRFRCGGIDMATLEIPNVSDSSGRSILIDTNQYRNELLREANAMSTRFAVIASLGVAAYLGYQVTSVKNKQSVY